MRLARPFLEAPIAHRALHDVTDGRPENSIAACKAAMRHGYGIEIDLQLSADGVAMVFHDYGLGRLTEATGPVAILDADTLSGVRLSGGNEGIPTLRAFLDCVAGQVPLVIELKDQDGGMGPKIGALEAATAAALQGYDGLVACMSFNPHSVQRMGALCPHIPVGLTTSAYAPGDWPLSQETCARLRDIPDYDRVGACFISHEAADLDRPRVAELKAAGADILTWTIRSPEEEANARRIVDNVTFEGYLPPLRG